MFLTACIEKSLVYQFTLNLLSVSCKYAPYKAVTATICYSWPLNKSSYPSFWEEVDSVQFLGFCP